MKHILFILTLLLMQNVHASKEGALSFSEFTLKCQGIGASGEITLKGKNDGKGNFNTLKILAFKKEYVLTKDQLKKLAPFSPNGIQMTYESGYKELGGRTVYLKFHTGFVSGIKTYKLVTVREDGSIAIGIKSQQFSH